MKVLIVETETLTFNNDVSLSVFDTLAEVKYFETLTREQLLKEIADVDAFLCNKTIVDREVLENAPNLKFIGTFATGYNNIDLDSANEFGVTVSNAPEYSTNAVAQQLMAYILMHYTKIDEYNRFVKSGGWTKSSIFSPLMFATDEVFGKTLGIIGYGSIGKAVSKAAKGLGMNVMVYTRTVREDGETKFVSLNELLSVSDIVTMHCPLNEQSAEMMNKDTFGKMKKGSFFINTARGGVVNEEALKDALVSGKLSGAAVDVLKKEPMSEACVLFNAPNIIITPHSAWAPSTTRQRLVELVADNLKAFMDGCPKNVVSK